MLTIEIALTDECNLGCRYCYVKNRKTRISIKDVRFFYDNLSNVLAKFGEVEYSISLFGGEPLLAMKELREVVAIFKQDPNCKYIVLVSNLTLLTKDIFDYIRSENIGVSWSCDGISATRPFLNKSNAVAVYTAKQDMITALTKTVKCMISPNNVHDMVQNAQFFKNFGIETINMQYLYDAVWQPKDVDVYAKNLMALADWWLDNQDIDLTLFSAVYKLWKNGSGKVSPCFAGSTGVCLATNGKIYPCQRYAQSDEQGTVLKNCDLCHNCILEGKCLVGCAYSIEHHGIIPEICTLHKITHKVALSLLKSKRFEYGY